MLHDLISEQEQQVDLPAVAELDYLDLDSETQAIVGECTCKIKALSKRTSIDTVVIGENLLTVKQHLKHGEFGKLLKTEFDWSPKTAYRFINVYNCFSCVKLTQLDIALSALYDLAEPAAPEPARQEILQRATQGERTTAGKARKILERYRHPSIIPEVLPPEQPHISAQVKPMHPVIFGL